MRLSSTIFFVIFCIINLISSELLADSQNELLTVNIVNEESNSELPKLEEQKFEMNSNEDKKAFNNDMILEQKPVLSADKNNLERFDINNKIKDNSKYIEKNRNKLSDIIDQQIDNNAVENVGLEDVPSPILKFILHKVRPFIEVRIDSMLVKAGFDSHLRHTISQEEQLKINVVENSSNNSGQKATCGQVAEASFVIEDEFGAVLDDSYKDRKTWLTIGGNQYPKGLELGMIGMRIGETREITSQNTLNAGHTELSLKLFFSGKPSVFRVTLHDLKENEMHDEIRDNLRFFDVIGSISRQLSCVDFVQLNFRILDASGKILYTNPQNKPVKFIIGSGFNTYLEQILIGAKNFGKRIAFVDTKYLQELKNIPYLNGIRNVIDENKAVVLELSPSLAKND
jgi:hypothetical protein